MYVGPKSITERPRKTKIGPEVAHVTRGSDTTFKVKRSKVNTCRGGGILWRPPAQVVVFVVHFFALNNSHNSKAAMRKYFLAGLAALDPPLSRWCCQYYHCLLTGVQGEQTRHIKHFHYVSWPDMTVPDKLSMLAFVRLVRSYVDDKKGSPIIVHCRLST